MVPFSMPPSGPHQRLLCLVTAMRSATVEVAAAQGLAGDDREEHLHPVQPRARGRREVQLDPRVSRQT